MSAFVHQTEPEHMQYYCNTFIHRNILYANDASCGALSGGLQYEK